MHYIRLGDDSYVISTANNTATINRKSINFNKIQQLIHSDEEVPEEIIDDLLNPPVPLNGVYLVYLLKDLDKMFYSHIKDTSYFFSREDLGIEDTWLGTPLNTVSFQEAKNTAKFIGTYISKEDIAKDWPEYLI